MGWNFFTKMGRKAWSSAKSTVSNVYNPIKKIVSTIHKGSNFIDDLLDRAKSAGVPASLVDLIRDNPIYSTVHDTIEFADDLVEKDLPKLGGAIENFVEHNILQKHAPKLGDLGRIAEEAGSIAGQVRGIGQRLNQGGTPNRNPSSRAVFGDGSSAS